MKMHQRGVSLVVTLFFVTVIGFVFVICAARVTPTLIEYQAISQAASRAAAGATVPEVRRLFDNAAQIADIKSISGKDLDVTKVDDKTVVSFAYTREIALAGPAYLLLKYAGSSK